MTPDSGLRSEGGISISAGQRRPGRVGRQGRRRRPRCLRSFALRSAPAAPLCRRTRLCCRPARPRAPRSPRRTTPCAPAATMSATALRITRQLVLERLIMLDCDQDAPLAAGDHRMTELAEFALDVACREALRELDAAHGAPLGAQGQRAELWVVGMGKLGARELNVSSDIDLIYVYDQDGETAGIAGGRGRISNHEYFTQAVKLIYGLIGDSDRARLRVPGRSAVAPERQLRPARGFAGRAGGLLPGAGREWERFAWLKSRVVAPRACIEERLGAGVAHQCAAVRLSPLPRLQRVRFAAGAAQADPRARGQAQRRPARARQRRQALARRHPRDRVHGATAAGGARRPVPRIAQAAHLAGTAARRRRRPDAPGHSRRRWRAPTNSCAGSSTASSTWTTSRPMCCRCAAARTTTAT